MSFDIVGAIEEGIDRLSTRTGAILLIALVAVGLAMTAVSNSFVQTLLLEVLPFEEAFAEVPDVTYEEFRRDVVTQFPVDVLDLSVGTLFALLLVVWLARIVLRIGAIRWFVEEGAGDLTPELFTRRLVWTVVNLLVGLVLYTIAVIVGLILLVIPGIFLAVALFFYNFEIVVEGENAIDALANSYELTRGNRLRLFLLGLLFALAGAILAQAGNPAFYPSSTTAALVGTVVTAGFGLVGIAVAAAAYVQLRDLAAEETVEALGPDDIPQP